MKLYLGINSDNIYNSIAKIPLDPHVFHSIITFKVYFKKKLPNPEHYGASETVYISWSIKYTENCI